MNQAKKDFLSLATPPARLGIEETSWFLGFNSHDVPVLVAAGLLKPLGRPAGERIQILCDGRIAEPPQ